ncbi:hypothetical protein AVEN_4830-1 [Araneus ventricosus]|uniref:Uncharacterized protein n=1 Tax=Araneus ventricosus TaxID=182803 RepID=A0A4Y2NZP0_ARAVE|nr:hypothetical protein AVEN_4830-1 [Araneus ventricosus]
MENLKGRERRESHQEQEREEGLSVKGRSSWRGSLIETVKAGMAKYKSAQSDLAGIGRGRVLACPQRMESQLPTGRPENTSPPHPLSSIEFDTEGFSIKPRATTRRFEMVCKGISVQPEQRIKWSRRRFQCRGGTKEQARSMHAEGDGKNKFRFLRFQY